MIVRSILLLAIAATAAAAQGAQTGVIAGIITADSGTRVVGMVRDSAAWTRIDSTGHFILAGIPAGTRTLTVMVVGASRKMVQVGVSAGDTTRVAYNVGRILQLTVTFGPETETWTCVRNKCLPDTARKKPPR